MPYQVPDFIAKKIYIPRPMQLKFRSLKTNKIMYELKTTRNQLANRKENQNSMRFLIGISRTEE